MTKRAFVVGAGGAVGEAIALALAAEGWRVTASMRTRREDAMARLAASGASIAFHDIATDPAWADEASVSDAVFFATHLVTTTRALARASRLAGGVIAFSSNNVALYPEAKVYRQLAAAEAALRGQYPHAMIIRPTLIYGDPRLPTLTRVLRMARTWPLVPLPGSGRARVQPAFYADLGAAAAGLPANGQAGAIYAVGGPEILTMRTLFAEALRVTSGRGAITPIPSWLLRAAAPLLPSYSADQAARADADRLVVMQTPLPANLAPRTPVRAGLERHWSAMLR